MAASQAESAPLILFAELAVNLSRRELNFSVNLTGSVSSGAAYTFSFSDFSLLWPLFFPDADGPNDLKLIFADRQLLVNLSGRFIIMSKK